MVGYSRYLYKVPLRGTGLGGCQWEDIGKYPSRIRYWMRPSWKDTKTIPISAQLKDTGRGTDSVKDMQGAQSLKHAKKIPACGRAAGVGGGDRLGLPRNTWCSVERHRGSIIERHRNRAHTCKYLVNWGNKSCPKYWEGTLMHTQVKIESWLGNSLNKAFYRKLIFSLSLRCKGSVWSS